MKTLPLLVFLGLPVFGAEYYVAPKGRDANPGTEARPWRSVRKAAQSAQAGDTVLIKSGTYHERIVFKHSGKPERYITFKAYPKHTPVLNGRDGAQWDGFLNFEGLDYIRLEGLAITNCRKGQAIYIIHRGKDPATHIELRGLRMDHVDDSPVQIRGNAHHILVENCTIHDCGASGIDVSAYKKGRPHHVTIRGNTVYRSKFAGVGSEQADHLLVEKNTCYDCGLGLDIGSGKRNIIRRNRLYRCEDGIALSSNEDSEVYENLVHDVKEAFFAYYWSAHGETHARNKWYRNVVYNATWALYEMNSKMTKKAREGPTQGHRYYNNLFYNIGGKAYRCPFWWRGVQDFRFSNNTVVMRADSDVFELTKGVRGAVFRNNIISYGGRGRLFNLNQGSRADVDYNLYWNRQGAARKIGTHDITGDPKFRNAAKGDFHLRPGSPGVDSATPLKTFQEDLEKKARPQGKAWDRGAYEFAGNPKTQP